MIFDQNILLHELYLYGITDLANNSFLSYLFNRKQFFSINGFNFTKGLGYGASQESVLVPLFFFKFYINDLHNAIQCSLPLYYANDTCLLNVQSKISKIKKV